MNHTTERYLSAEQVIFFINNGYLVVENIISPEEIELYKKIYDDFLTGKIDTGKSRSDLGDGLGSNNSGENITQIMWPSAFVPELVEMPFHQRALAISKELMGEDAEMDFDMLINKAPLTNTPLPGTRMKPIG
jgi:hypothetical protein